MRRHLSLMMLGLLSMLLLGLYLSASLAIPPVIEAEVEIRPQVFNLRRNGTGAHGVITAFISNLEDAGLSYDVKDINISTIMLYHETTSVASALYAKAAKGKLIAKFDATTVANQIMFKLWHLGIAPPTPPSGYPMEFTIKGELTTGEKFAGTDTIKIVFPST